MKLELTTYDIAERLFADEYGGWSRAGAFALAEWLEDMEEDTGEETTLDVVAIRCDFSEYGSLIDWASDYFGGPGDWQEPLGVDDSVDLGPEDTEPAIRDYIHDNGFLIEFDGGIIVSSF
jgi:hypothetical protein